MWYVTTFWFIEWLKWGKRQETSFTTLEFENYTFIKTTLLGLKCSFWMEIAKYVQNDYE